MSKMGKRYVSDAMAAIHETAEDLERAGVIDENTMKEFDRACLIDTQSTPSIS